MAITLKSEKRMQSRDVSSDEISRRTFLVATAAVTLGIAITEAFRIMVKYLSPPKTEGFGGVFTLGSVDEFPPDSVTYIRQGRCYIVHNGDGLLALYQRCTHLGCLVPWQEDEQHFVCPCHAGRYSPEGEVISGPPPKPLSLFKLEVKDGNLAVDTSQAIERDRYVPSQAQKV
jgi:cytochrome b6-f complex iron-sulfur subunit